MQKKVNVKDILRVTNGNLICGNENEEIEKFVRDSREVQEGDTYIALKGEKFDGNDFYKEAIENGAKVCILSKNAEITEDTIENKIATIIVVDDTLKALQEIATYKRSLYNIPVIAITGSVGKTSTKDLAASVVSQKYKTLKTQGNYNNEIGLPLTILSLTDEEALVVEMGMNHFGEIRKLTNIAKPTIAVITNIGTAHIGNLGSRENILKAKMEILEGLQTNKVVINNDNDLLHEWALKNKEKYDISTYGIENDSDIMAKNIKAYENKSEFTVDDTKISVPVGGEHFVLNSLCGIAVGQLLEIPLQKIANGIANLELSKKRMEITNSKTGAILINDTYNANYDSMSAAINYLKNIQNKRKIVVLGDMLELGDFSKQLHENVGKEVTESIDILITVGMESKYIAQMAKAKEIFVFNNNEEAINKLKQIISKDDAILFKASNGMKFSEIVEALKAC